MNIPYDKDYYENGLELGISGYKNYKWLPDLTLPMCQSIIQGLKISKTSNVLDFGCAKGYVVKAFRMLGITNTFGADISDYAIENSDPEVKNFLTKIDCDKRLSGQLNQKFDWILCKDVLEHVPYTSLNEVLLEFSLMTDNVFIVVPLGDGKKFIIDEYEKDVTHVIREDMNWWIAQLSQSNFEIRSKQFLFPGVKDNWSHYPMGNAFITATSKK